MELKENIPSFLNEFLSRPASSIPKGAQWVIAFQNLTNLLETIDEAYKFEPQAKLWNTKKAAELILTSDYQETRGCLFAQAIQMPGERIQTNVEGNIQSNALIRGRVGGGRENFNPLKITFLETNVSFVDSFLRGWALATATFGLIARTDYPYRTMLNCYKFGVQNKNQPPYVLQEVSFEGVCCTSVSDEEYNYTPLAGTALMREAEFIFNSYAVNTSEKLASEVVENKIPEMSTIVPPLQPVPDTVPSIQVTV